MRRFALIPLALLVLLLSACDTIDCTLNNTVECQYGFYNQSGSAVQLNGALTITAAGTDSVLLNRKVGAKSISIPMSYWQEADVLTFTLDGDGYTLQDQVTVKKSNIEHFESPDCPTVMFHQIQEVSTTGQFIDTILIVSPAVNYDGIENLQIRLRTDD